MAIAIDATSEGFESGGTTVTVSHTITGSDTFLWFSTFKFGGGDSVTGVTWNGTSMTQIGKITSDASGFTYGYAIATSDTGTHDVVATSSSSVQWFVTNASYTGVDQTTPNPDTVNNSSATADSFSESVTTSVDNSWLVIAGRTPGKAPTAGSETIVRKLNATSGDAGWTLDSDGARTPAGSEALAWSYSGSSTSYWVMSSIAPAVAAGPASVKTFNTIAIASVKTIDTIAIASVKTIDTIA